MSAGTSWDIKAYASQAQKIITEEIKTRDAILQQFSTRKSAFPLRVLEEVSRSIPKDTLIDVTNFSMQGNQVVIEGETDSFTTSEKILDLLKGVPSFSTVERKSQENKPGSEGKIVKFTVSATLKEGG
jgi:Tfp pilus assembly protein PilN